MKKLLILTVMSVTLFAGCSNNSSTGSESAPATGQETMSADSTLMNLDTTKAAADKMAKDSADAAHGHSH